MKNPTEKSGKYQLRCIKKMRSCKQRFSFSGSTMCHSRSANSQRLCAYLSRMLHVEPFNHLESINYVGCTTKVRFFLEMKK